jgi:hypothetical protein
LSSPFLIRYEGLSGPYGRRHTIRGVDLVIERDGDRVFGFHSTMSGTLAAYFLDDPRDRELEGVLLEAGLDELERGLRAGIYAPPDGKTTAEIVFTSEQEEHLRHFVDRDKRCLWQDRLDRGWICTATEIGGDERTSASLCAGCPVPDERVLCVEFMHPVINSITAMGAATQRVAARDPLCNIGKNPGDGKACHLGGLECARRSVATAATFADPPPDVARRAADEIDYFSLVFRDRYSSRVWTIPQARSISEFFGDCTSAEDFQRRIAALADLLGKLSPHDQLEEQQRVD